MVDCNNNERDDSSNTTQILVHGTCGGQLCEGISVDVCSCVPALYSITIYQL